MHIKRKLLGILNFLYAVFFSAFVEGILPQNIERMAESLAEKNSALLLF